MKIILTGAVVILAAPLFLALFALSVALTFLVDDPY